MTHTVTETISIDAPVCCPHFADVKLPESCNKCRFFGICEAAREEYGE